MIPSDARFREGLALFRRGELREAETVLEEIVRLRPDHFEALYLLGLAALRTGRPNRAAELIGRAIASNGDVPAAHTNLGTALLQLGRYEESLACFRTSLDLKFDQMEAHFNSGIAQLSSGKTGEAVLSFDNAIALAPDRAAPWLQRGVALSAMNRFDAALLSIDRAIALQPDDADAHYCRGTANLKWRRFEGAAADFTRAIALRHDFAAAYNDRGLASTNLGRFAQAVPDFRRATELRPDFAQAYNNLGGALWHETQIEEAMACYYTAIALRPDYPEAYNNRGAAMADLLRLDDAIAAYDKAIELRPDHAEAQFNKGSACLQMGRFDPGWRLFEWRKKVPDPEDVREYRQPAWNGDRDISGKTLFIYPEGGLGDTIQFCRYARLALSAGARVVMEVQEPVFALLREAIPGVEVIPSGRPPGAFDYHCASMSLPLAFGTTLETIPAGPPYIRAGEGLRALWADRLQPSTRIRAGLVWSGNPNYKHDRVRSIGLTPCLPLLSTGVDWFVLQKEIREPDAAILAREGGPTLFRPEQSDFRDTAALIELMDLVVTSDTSVAHLAGAMGKKTWLLLSFHPDWRWLLDRDDSPWYPSMRLFRQRAQGDWAGTIEQVATALPSIARRP